MSIAATGLKAELRRAERARKRRAFLLVLPLLLFLIVTFVIPIGDMLRRSVHDTELAGVWPRVAQQIGDWENRSRLPDEALFAALAADLAESRENRSLATAARRLNYAIDNGRSLVFGTARKLPDSAGSWKQAIIEAEPRWGDVELWGAVAQASGPLTGFYLLQALDLKRTAGGDIVSVPSNQAVYVDILLRTFTVSLVVTLLCLALGFPVAYLLATLPTRLANPLMILVLLPFWTSLLVRTAAWIVLLQEQGLVNEAMIWLGLIDQPVRLIYNRIGVYVAMTHVLLPFMILPLYAVMKGISPAYMRAATSLGASPTRAFVKVYLPLTAPGIAAGALLVFILALGYYITPALVGGAADQMISYFIAFYTSDTVNWGMAAALGAVLLTATLILYALYNRLSGSAGMRVG
ncbi:ABC transporter permease [Oceanibaculum pacificum]|uniref:Polyamine ABC transporter substrate-binding protein n=1 Tax=Oceanibaculum pacificum TaxID=580166 RepID=A0A154W2B2_9PROT|nr:ABC transporter permease [Oceanibaculum pacificum]KZD07603.1 polyamine ABC transporter substrate-binding protein [Oceanibaculum pacificum]